MIKAIDLGKTVSTSEGELTILKGIDLEIKKSESVAIVGASGSGKTTLLSLLAGLDQPSRGQIFLGDYEITALDEEERAQVRAELVGFVFQSFQLLSSLSAIENVMLPSELKGDATAQSKARELLERVGLGLVLPTILNVRFQIIRLDISIDRVKHSVTVGLSYILGNITFAQFFQVGWGSFGDAFELFVTHDIPS